LSADAARALARVPASTAAAANSRREIRTRGSYRCHGPGAMLRCP
jgi:hypothetical protein